MSVTNTALLAAMGVSAMAWAMQLSSMRALQSSWLQLGGRLSGANDLETVRACINKNMFLAMAHLVLSLALILFLLWCVRWEGLGLRNYAVSMLAFVLLTLPAVIAGRHFEARMRQLDTSSCPQEVRGTYESWLGQWKSRRFRLKD